MVVVVVVATVAGVVVAVVALSASRHTLTTRPGHRLLALNRPLCGDYGDYGDYDDYGDVHHQRGSASQRDLLGNPKSANLRRTQKSRCEIESGTDCLEANRC